MQTRALSRPFLLACCLSLLALQAPLRQVGPWPTPAEREGMSAPQPLVIDSVKLTRVGAPATSDPTPARPATPRAVGGKGASPGHATSAGPVSAPQIGRRLVLWGRLQLEGG